MKSYFKAPLLLAAVMLPIAIADMLNPFLNLHAHTVWAILYNFLLSIATGAMIKNGLKGDHLDFYNFFMGAFTIRLLITMFALLGYFHFIKDDQVRFAFTFFVVYLLFTGFEISTLLPNLRRD